ncbi:J domain-containing protein [Sulfurimonas microaerophilic]|uniref:J domain-containing protein n=1 Tax=Sulfurimonas microaerophilic TaxID=3058392 RepID=UPI0027152644|nr:J domain-containing protein [Sulfurimonas sp. hsl 1-7]
MEEEFIIWNGNLGVRDFVTIGEIKIRDDKTYAWLEEPYEMVGPFDLNELKTDGKICFAACIVISKEKWIEDGLLLRQEALDKQRKQQEDIDRFNKQKQVQAKSKQHKEKEFRELLCLPLEGVLETAQIKAAYRRISKKVHPDLGGDHEKFIQITIARDTLLEISTF